MKYVGYIFLLCYSTVTYCHDVHTYIPDRANKYLPLLKDETETYFRNHPLPPYMAGLIEHESCITLKHKRCWSPASRLKTKREEGAGLGQLTRAYKKDGSLRFDTIERLKRRYKYLKELSWSNVYKRPDLQIRAIVTLWQKNYTQLPNDIDALNKIAMADSAYNGGYRGMYRDRQLCKFKKGCNPKIWFNNVEKTCSKSKKVLYGNRSACDINRHHVRDVLQNRTPKYVRYWLDHKWFWWEK